MGADQGFFGEPLFFDSTLQGHFEIESVSYFNNSSDLRSFLKTKKMLSDRLPPVGLRRDLWSTLSAPSFEAFQRDFEKIKAAQNEGRLQKIVPAVFESATLSDAIDFKEWDAYFLERFLSFHERLPAEQKARLFVYAYSDGQRFHAGMSPEFLFHQHAATTFETMALAGSAPLSREDPDFLNDAKELREHQLVIEDIRGKLEALGCRSVEVSAIEVLALPKIKHLLSRIKFSAAADRSQPQVASELLRKLHPTSALGVQPFTAFTRAFLQQLESSQDRGSLGSPLTLCDVHHQRCFALVGIRGIERRRNQLYLGAGCGIVAESDLAKEWAELALKRASVKAVFAEDAGPR